MTTETVRIQNNTNETDWFKVADASHDFVHLITSVNFLISEEKPTNLDFFIGATGSGVGIKIRNSNSNVWVRLAPNSSDTIVRGDADITVIDYTVS